MEHIITEIFEKELMIQKEKLLEKFEKKVHYLLNPAMLRH